MDKIQPVSLKNFEFESRKTSIQLAPSEFPAYHNSGAGKKPTYFPVERFSSSGKLLVEALKERIKLLVLKK